MPDWIMELASELPMLGLALGFLYFMRGFISAENARRDAIEVRHSSERKDLHASFLESISTVSGECHASQDRASAALKDIADATDRTGATMMRIDGKLDMLIPLAKS